MFWLIRDPVTWVMPLLLYLDSRYPLYESERGLQKTTFTVENETNLHFVFSYCIRFFDGPAASFYNERVFAVHEVGRCRVPYVKHCLVAALRNASWRSGPGAPQQRFLLPSDPSV